MKLVVPPLRERVEDVEPLAMYFLEKFSSSVGGKKYEFAPEVMEAFRGYKWPGNVRELENVIKNAIAYSTGGLLTLGDFPHLFDVHAETEQCRICMSTRFPSMVEYREGEMNFKRAYFEEALRRAGNNVAKAATIAGLTPQGFRKILSSLNIEKG